MYVFSPKCSFHIATAGGRRVLLLVSDSNFVNNQLVEEMFLNLGTYPHSSVLEFRVRGN